MVLMNLESAAVPKDQAGKIRIEEFEGLQTAKLTSPAMDTKNKHFVFPDDDEVDETSPKSEVESDKTVQILQVQHDSPPPTLNLTFENKKSLHTLDNDNETVTVIPMNIKMSCESIRPPDEIDYLNHTESDESTHSLLDKYNSNNSKVHNEENEIVVKQKQLCCVFF